ncbi:glycosyltransferase, partial [Candidatus Saccharibacteria bacterium]|nr:glycosyltransferase [Candidatus Saccharibacteria bacterium]
GPFGGTQQARHVITGKTFQSLACGVATLVGEGLATDEVFVDRENALVVPQNSVEKLAESIRWAANNPQALRTIADNGRKLYEVKFSTVALGRLARPLIDSLES